MVLDISGETVDERVTMSSLWLGDALVDGEGLTLTTEAVGEMDPLEAVEYADCVALLLTRGLSVGETDADEHGLGDPLALEEAVDETDCDSQDVEERDGAADRDAV